MLKVNDGKMEEKIQMVCKKFQIDNLHARYSRIVEIKWCIYKVLRNKGFSYPEIARIFSVNHTGILHLIKNRDFSQSKYYQHIEDIFSSDNIHSLLSKNKVTYSKKWISILNKKGYACQLCGYSEVLEIHHLDKNAGNSINNLVVLCPNCHTKLHRKIIFLYDELGEPIYPQEKSVPVSKSS